MKLAIADPPYPPNLLASKRATGHGPPLRASRWYGGKPPNRHLQPADCHPGASDWDREERHRELLDHLVRDYDGWAIATTPDAVAAGVYAPLPYGTKVMAWIKPRSMPTGARISSSWEAVIVLAPEGRRARSAAVRGVRDYLVASPPGLGFAGAKPSSWTRWVLDALGYDQDTDTVADLFPGSGAVSAEVAQGILEMPMPLPE